MVFRRLEEEDLKMKKMTKERSRRPRRIGKDRIKKMIGMRESKRARKGKKERENERKREKRKGKENSTLMTGVSNPAISIDPSSTSSAKMAEGSKWRGKVTRVKIFTSEDADLLTLVNIP